MKRTLEERVIEQLAMAVVVGIFFFGVCMCADETEGKAMTTYFLQTLGGLGLIGFAFWLGRALVRKGIITEPKDDSEEL